MINQLKAAQKSEPVFPQAYLTFRKKKYWHPAQIRRFQRQLRGEDDEDGDDDGDDPLDPAEPLLNSAQVRAIFGNISQMTLWRWLNPERDDAAREREQERADA